MSKTEFGFRRIFRVPLLELCWLGSWGSPAFKRFGLWRTSRGLTLRYRAYLLHLGLPLSVREEARG